MKIIRAVGGTGAGLLLCGMLLAQLPEYTIEREKNGPDFYYSVISMAADSSDRSIFEIHVQIPYDELQFVQSGDVFRAEYEISLTFFDLQGEQADARIIKQEVVAYDYKETNSLNAFSFLRQRFEFVPGKYDLLVSVMDMDNQLASRRKSSLILPDYHSSDLEISDLAIADRISTDSAGIMTFFPNVLANMDDFQKSLFIWFEVYNRLPEDSIRIAYQIFDYKEKEQRKEVIYRHLKGWRTPVILKIDKGELESGKYIFKMTVGDRETGIMKNTTLAVNWIGMPVFASNMEKAIEQLKYIAKSGEIKKLKKAKAPAKDQMFKQFWQERDPSPGTETNELMEEYYRRVEFSNTTFGTYVEGWKTDRGMVYIILGPPNDIERHPFDPESKPYEIWSYYRVNRQFVFVDYSGFGEYRLITPNWDVLRMDR